MAAIPTTSPAPGHAGGGVKVSSEPEREEERREACSELTTEEREKETWRGPADTSTRDQRQENI